MEQRLVLERKIEVLKKQSQNGRKRLKKIMIIERN